jgi:hypothetical protein
VALTALRHRQSTRPHVARRLGATEVSCLCTIPLDMPQRLRSQKLMHSTNLGVRREPRLPYTITWLPLVFFSASLHHFPARRKTHLDSASYSKPQANDVDDLSIPARASEVCAAMAVSERSSRLLW